MPQAVSLFRDAEDVPDTSRSMVLLATTSDAAGRALQKLLELRGFDVRPVETARDAREAILRDRPDAAIVDLAMPRSMGLDIVAAMPMPAPVLMLAKAGNGWSELERLRPRSRLVPRPCSLMLLIESLEEMLRNAAKVGWGRGHQLSSCPETEENTADELDARVRMQRFRGPLAQW